MSAQDPKMNEGTTVVTGELKAAVQRYIDEVAPLILLAAEMDLRGPHHDVACAELALRVTLGMGKPDPVTYSTARWQGK